MPEVSEQYPEIYQYVLKEEANFKTDRVPLASNWKDWNMYEHVDRSFTLKNSRFYKGQQDYTRPFNNIILPIANVSYRTEGFDVKDAQIFVDNPEHYHKSFLANKFHSKWSKKHGIDKAIDESVQSYYDYGLTLVKNVDETRPEVVSLQTIAFCDQTNIMAGPICLKHNLSISEIKDMKGKWNDDAIEKTLLMAKFSKDSESEDGDKTTTPGKYVEVYELHGSFPESWLGKEKLGEEWQDTGDYEPQVHFITYYTSQVDGKSKVGITLFKGRETKPVFKALERDPIIGRACGRGGIEELFHPQIWTNKAEYHIDQMLETVSKVLMVTNKKRIAQNNNFYDMKQGQVIDLGDDGQLQQLGMQPINKAAFDAKVEKWEQVARTIGSAADPQLGLNPVSGTPLGTTEIVTSQGQGIHEYRRGQIAEFWAEIYREWVIPHLEKEIRKGKKWLERLSLEELDEIANKMARNEFVKEFKEQLFNGKLVTEEDRGKIIQIKKEQILEEGTDQFMEIIKDEFKGLPMDIEVNIAGKQADRVEMINKLNSVFRTLFTPGAIEAIQNNGELGNLLNEILETAGLSPIRYGRLKSPRTQEPLAEPKPEEAGAEALEGTGAELVTGQPTQQPTQ